MAQPDLGTQHHLLYLAATTAVTVVSIVVADRVRSLHDTRRRHRDGRVMDFTADRLLTEVHRALVPAADGADPLAAGTERRNVAG